MVSFYIATTTTTKTKNKKTPTNQKANAVVQLSERLTEAKNMTTAIIQVKYM